MPPSGRRDAGDRESSGEHSRSSQSTPSQNSPSAVVEPRLEDLRNRLAALRNRTSRNRLAAADSCTSTAVELNQHKENGEMVDYCQRYVAKITRPHIRYMARLVAGQIRADQMEVSRREEEEEVDVVN